MHAKVLKVRDTCETSKVKPRFYGIVVLRSVLYSAALLYVAIRSVRVLSCSNRVVMYYYAALCCVLLCSVLR